MKKVVELSKELTDLQLDEYIRNLRHTYNLLRSLADELHADINLTASLRAVLEYLSRNGSSTVPQIAEKRSVSRQSVQKLVNILVRSSLVNKEKNPQHHRSDLIQLTTKGKRIFKKIQAKEKKILKEVSKQLPKDEFKSAQRFINSFRKEISLQINKRKGESQ